MTIPKRKTARLALASLIETNITALQEVYPYLVFDPEGQSPVCTVEDGAHQPNTHSAVGRYPFQFTVGFLVRRDRTDGDDADAENAEDLIDDLANDLATLLENNYGGRFYQPSEIGYEVIGGLAYRSEYHFVEISWIST